MINFEIGLEAECFLKNKEGEIIAPSFQLPIDGSGNIIEIRADPGNTPQKTIENFYRKFEQIKELCYPLTIFLSKSEILNKQNFRNKAYAYKYERRISPIDEKFTQTCGLHIHISVEFLNEKIKIPEDIIMEILKELDKELFEIVPYDHSRALSDYRIKRYPNNKSGFEYRSLYFNETVLKAIPQIVIKTNCILQACNSLKLLAISSTLNKTKDIEDFDKINIEELYSYIKIISED